MKGLTYEESRELWNILNAKHTALVEQLSENENLMGLLEKRTGMEKTIKITRP